MITALHTGFRPSEFFALAWEDTEFRNHLITVEAAYAKNGKARGVPMNEVLTEALRTTKIDELTGLVFSNRRKVPGTYKCPAMTIDPCRDSGCNHVLEG